MNIRIAKRNRFTQIPNEVFEDDRLSACAVGVLCYLLSKPDNWTANKKDIMNRFDTPKNPVTANKLQQVYREFRQAGYAILVPRKVDNGDGTFTMKGSEYLIFDTPQEQIPTPQDVTGSEDSRPPKMFRGRKIPDDRKSLGVYNNTITINNNIINSKDNKSVIAVHEKIRELYETGFLKSGEEVVKIEHLHLFEQQPTYKQFESRLKKEGLQRLIECLIKIEKYCKDNPEYTVKRKSLNRILGVFLKNMPDKELKELQDVFCGEYRAKYGNVFKFSTKGSEKGLSSLKGRILEDLANYNISQDHETLKLYLRKYLKGVAQILENSPEKFTPSLLAYNYAGYRDKIKNNSNHNQKTTSHEQSYEFKGW